MREINLQLLFTTLLQRIKWIILFTALGGILLGGYTYFFVPSNYQSEVQMYVSNYKYLTEKDSSSVSISGLTASQSLVNEYIVIIENDMVIDQISAELRKHNYVFGNKLIRKIMDLSSVDETAMLSCKVTTNDPALSKTVCDAVAKVVPGVLKETMDIGSVKVMAPAEEGTIMGPSRTGKAILGATIGFVLSVGGIFVIFMMDNTVWNEQELKRRLDNITVLGEVPTILDENNTKKRKAKGDK